MNGECTQVVFPKDKHQLTSNDPKIKKLNTNESVTDYKYEAFKTKYQIHGGSSEGLKINCLTICSQTGRDVK